MIVHIYLKSIDPYVVSSLLLLSSEHGLGYAAVSSVSVLSETNRAPKIDSLLISISSSHSYLQYMYIQNSHTSSISSIDIPHFNPCSLRPCLILSCTFLTASISSIFPNHSLYLGNSSNSAPRPTSLNTPSPTSAHVQNARSAYVHLSPTSQPVALRDKPSSRTLMTRRISVM
jgi:hypothetical protein